MRSACIAWKKRQSHITMNAEKESERSLRDFLTGKARINTYKDGIAETELVKERKRARVERGADDQVAVRHAGASGGDIRENQHEEDRMRETFTLATENQRQQVKNILKSRGRQCNLSKMLRVQQRLQIGLLLWNILRVVRHKIDRGPYLRRSQVTLMTTYKFLRWVHSTRWMDERVVTSEKCWNGIEEKMPEISREMN